MGLQRVLSHFHALEDRVPMRFWGSDESKSTVATHACGYCANGRPCTHETIRPNALKPLTSRRSDTAMQRLSELLADVRRQIGQLETVAEQRLFILRYVVRVDDQRTAPDGRTHHFTRQHTDEEVMALMGYRNKADYLRGHNRNLAAMECRLVDYFERDTAGAAPVDDLLDEAMAELQVALAA